MIRVQRQDRAAFAVLVDRHLEAIHAFNFRFLRNAEDAADLAQEAFLRVWNSAGTYRPGRVKFTTWLHRIARNLCIDLHRRRKNTEPLTSAVSDDSLRPDQAPAEQRLAAALAHELAALPERQRTALMLCHHQGMSNRDAALVLGVSVDALESLLARGRRTLRVALRDYR